MTPAARLAALLAELPADALLPVGYLREQLGEEALQAAANDAGAALARDLTVKEFGACFGKSASTARLWCEQGRVGGAWKLNGREWRIPAGSVEQFRQAQGAPAPEAARPAAGHLSDWRHARKAG
jgi:hypothetical protein